MYTAKKLGIILVLLGGASFMFGMGLSTILAIWYGTAAIDMIMPYAFGGLAIAWGSGIPIFIAAFICDDVLGK